MRTEIHLLLAFLLSHHVFQLSRAIYILGIIIYRRLIDIHHLKRKAHLKSVKDIIRFITLTDAHTMFCVEPLST